MKRALPLFNRLLFSGALLAGGLLLNPAPAGAQVKIGTNANTPNSSAVLELESTTKGFLPPRATRIQMNAVANPAEGLMFFCSDCKPAGPYFWDGLIWKSIGASTLPAALFGGGSLSCGGATTGVYLSGTPLDSTHTKEIVVTVTTAGGYQIKTDEVNGVRFSSAGVLNATGEQIVVLKGTGTPDFEGTYDFTISVEGQQCTFSINFPPIAVFVCDSATNTLPNMTLVNGNSYSGTYILPYIMGNGQAYGTETLTENGLTLTRTAGTYAAAGGTITYTLSGTYTGSSTELFYLPEGCTVPIPYNNIVTTLAGSGSAGSSNGTGTAAEFSRPYHITGDASGNLYMADLDNHQIRKITPAGVVTTYAGSTQGFVDSSNALGAKFQFPEGVAFDAGGNLYVTDFLNNAVRKVTAGGAVSTFAGNGTAGFVNGADTAARFHHPNGVATDTAGNIYVTEEGNHTIRKITPAGVVTTFAGSGTAGLVDDTTTAAEFNSPRGIATDSAGNVYVADHDNHIIRKITPAGAVTTFAGDNNSGFGGFADGTGTAALFVNPTGLTLDGAGNIYVTDNGNARIRRITPAGEVTTVAGNGNNGGANGPGAIAEFNGPAGIWVDASGIIYVSELSSHTIRKITP